MLAHSGILMFKKGNKQAGLHFYAGLSPYEFPKSLFSFLVQFKDFNFSDSFNQYIQNINIVSVESAINSEDRKMLTKIQGEKPWIDLSDIYTGNESILVDMLFSSSFTELPDVSTLILSEEDSDISHINHVYVIDLDDESVSHYIGGLGFNFYRTLSFKKYFKDISDDAEMETNDLLSHYSELLKKEYGTIV